jgi:hypothetical protein
MMARNMVNGAIRLIGEKRGAHSRKRRLELELRRPHTVCVRIALAMP